MDFEKMFSSEAFTVTILPIVKSIVLALFVGSPSPNTNIAAIAATCEVGFDKLKLEYKTPSTSSI